MLTALLLFDGPGKTRKLLHLARRRFDLDDVDDREAGDDRRGCGWKDGARDAPRYCQ